MCPKPCFGYTYKVSTCRSHHKWDFCHFFFRKIIMEISRNVGETPFSWAHLQYGMSFQNSPHDDVIKWKHFPRYCAFVWGIHRSPVNSPHKGQWRGPLMFSLICAWINSWVNNREAGDLRRHCANYDVTVMRNSSVSFTSIIQFSIPI